MEISSTHQVYVFGLCVLSGMLCGVFFDLQRFLRRVHFAGGVRTTLEDILFATVCIGVILGVGFYFNNGEMRYYQVMGSISGALLYAALFSRLIMKIFMAGYNAFNVLIIKPLIKIIHILSVPVKKLLYALRKLFLRVRKFIGKLLRNAKQRKKRLKKRMKML